MLRKNVYSLLLMSTFAAGAFTAPALAQEAAPFRLKAAAPARAEALPTPVSGESALRKMPASQQDLFLSGEFASRKMPFFALPEEASGKARFAVTLQTAISVAPEQSQMAVRINGNEIGSASLSAGDPRRIEFDVPENTLQPGYNAVEISASQRHRVDCSIDATYELWTKIDPENTGFVFANTDRATPSMLDLMAIAGTNNGRTNIRVVLPAGSTMTDYDRATRIVQAIGILGNFSQPVVEFGATPGTGPGLDIHIGGKAPAGEPLLIENADASGSRKRLTVPGLGGAEIDARIDDLVAMAATRQDAGTREGQMALANQKGRALAPGQKVTLRDLGFDGQRFSGRRFVSNVNFTMPSDFYPGDYDSANLHLSALYVGGLAPDAVLIVKANDKMIANISLSSRRAGEIRDQRLPIPFSALRPGQNTLEIEARLPSHLDAACESVENASGAVRLAIDETSYLDIPNYARIGRYPDISGLTSGLPRALNETAAAPVQLFVPNRDRNAMNAAATFAAKLAYASERVNTFRFTSVLPQTDRTHMIAFGAYDTLPSQLVSQMKLDFVTKRRLAMAETRAVEVASLETDAGRGQVASDADDRTLVAAAYVGAGDLADRASEFVNAPLEQSGRLIETVRNKVADGANRLRLSLPFGGEANEPAFSPSPEAAFVVAQASPQNGSIWTVVAARKADGIMNDVDVLTGPNVWNKLGGAAQSFSDTGMVLDQKVASSQHLFQTQPVTVSNSRLVAAGWLANNATTYVGALLVAAVMLGIGTFMMLYTGRRNHG